MKSQKLIIKAIDLYFVEKENYFIRSFETGQFITLNQKNKNTVFFTIYDKESQAIYDKEIKIEEIENRIYTYTFIVNCHYKCLTDYNMMIEATKTNINSEVFSEMSTSVIKAL